jgi:hypothetical protein
LLLLLLWLSWSRSHSISLSYEVSVRGYLSRPPLPGDCEARRRRLARCCLVRWRWATADRHLPALLLIRVLSLLSITRGSGAPTQREWGSWSSERGKGREGEISFILFIIQFIVSFNLGSMNTTGIVSRFSQRRNSPPKSKLRVGFATAQVSTEANIFGRNCVALNHRR